MTDHWQVAFPGPAGDIIVLLERQLIWDGEQSFGTTPAVYPVTIVQARYGGSYEGAPWLCFPADPEELSSRAWQDWDGSDVPCMIWHRAARDAGWPVGRGGSPDDAYRNLLDRVIARANLKMEDLQKTTTGPETEGGK